MAEQEITPAEFRAIWDAKPTLRAVYRDYYARIERWRRPGVTVEIGAGSGNLRDETENVLSSDIVVADHLDLVLDAQCLPFADRSVANFVGVDVLHHIEFPRNFLVESARALTPAGRVVLIEPGITPLSRVVFKLGHPEPVDESVDPLVAGEPNPNKHPFDSNQALPTLLAGREDCLPRAVGLRLVHAEFISLLAYPLSGGFRRWSLIPERVVEPLLRLERRVEGRLGRWAGFRLVMVLERCAD